MTNPMKVESEQIALLEKLCNAVGVSGDEGEIRKIIATELNGIADEMQVDAFGNLLVTRHARGVEHPMRVTTARETGAGRQRSSARGNWGQTYSSGRTR